VVGAHAEAMTSVVTALALDGPRQLDARRHPELAEDVAQVRLQWERIVATVPPWDGPPVWHHGDLDVRNWLVRMDASAA
jgi:aminoglycoside phosphotransferase (APT) family kinase protein